MLPLTIHGNEFFNEQTEEFVPVESKTIQLEHSLISISKWESIWCKPFLDKTEKTVEETISYIKCMTLTPNVDPLLYECLTNDDIAKVKKYIAAPMTATTFSNVPKKPRMTSEKQTNETIYSDMFELGIPIECEKWHLNRLLTLIKVRSLRNEPPKKMSKRELASRNSALNAARRKRLNSRG